MNSDGLISLRLAGHFHLQGRGSANYIYVVYTPPPNFTRPHSYLLPPTMADAARGDAFASGRRLAAHFAWYDGMHIMSAAGRQSPHARISQPPISADTA